MCPMASKLWVSSRIMYLKYEIMRRRWGDYSLLMGSAETLATSKDLRNRVGVLPHTVIDGRNGKVAVTHAGVLTEALLDAVLLPLL